VDQKPFGAMRTHSPYGFKRDANRRQNRGSMHAGNYRIKETFACQSIQASRCHSATYALDYCVYDYTTIHALVLITSSYLPAAPPATLAP
jgi:hypothetical protein